MMKKNDFDSYILELQQFTNENISTENIYLDDNFYHKAKSLGGFSPEKSDVYDFSYKDDFQNNILNFFNSSPITIWTPRSNTYGYLKLSSIEFFNFSFSFNSNSEGIISILATDLSKRVVIEFSTDGNKQILEVDYYTYI